MLKKYLNRQDIQFGTHKIQIKNVDFEMVLYAKSSYVRGFRVKQSFFYCILHFICLESVFKVICTNLLNSLEILVKFLWVKLTLLFIPFILLLFFFSFEFSIFYWIHFKFLLSTQWMNQLKMLRIIKIKWQIFKSIFKSIISLWFWRIIFKLKKC